MATSLLGEIPISSKQLCEYLGGMHSNTLREYIKAGKIPDFDVKLTQKSRYWHRSTLVRAGILEEEREPSSAPGAHTL